MTRAPQPLPVLIAATALLLALPASVQGDEGKGKSRRAVPAEEPARPPTDEEEVQALMTLEGQAALKALLWQRVLLVSVKPAGGGGEDPAFLPERFGQAVRVVREGRTEVLTAAQLVEGAVEVRLARTGSAEGTSGSAAGATGPSGAAGAGPEATLDAAPGKAAAIAATVGVLDDATLLASLACPEDCGGAPAIEAAPPDTWAKGQPLYFVIPALADQPVMGQTVSQGRQVAPFDAMIGVPGRLPPGTVLFDRKGRPLALAVRTLPGLKNATLASVLVLPATGKPPAEGSPPGNESGGAPTGGRSEPASPREAPATPDTAPGTDGPSLPATLSAPAATPDSDLQPIPFGSAP